MTKTERITNRLTLAVVVLVLLVGAGAFTLSYNSLHGVARSYGTYGGLAWIWPLLIDAPIVAFTLALLVAQVTGHRTWGWWSLLVLYGLATATYNVAHAASSTLMAWSVAVVPPLGLFLTTEALRHLARIIIQRGPVYQNEPVHKVPAREPTKAQPEPIVKASEPVHSPGPLAPDRMKRIMALKKQKKTILQIADELGVSQTTVKRDLSRLNGQATKL